MEETFLGFSQKRLDIVFVLHHYQDMKVHQFSDVFISGARHRRNICFGKSDLLSPEWYKQLPNISLDHFLRSVKKYQLLGARYNIKHTADKAVLRS